MNPLTIVWRKLTYRTEHSTPDPATGLNVMHGRWGGRTVHDPRLPGYLHARRARLLREVLDPVDSALLDPDTLALLNTTADGLVARYTASYIRELGNPRDQEAARSPARVGS